MRKLSFSVALAALLVAPVAAGAATASFTGNLSIAISDLATISVAGSGTGSSGGVGGTATIPQSAFTAAFGTPVSPPLAGLFPGLVVGATGLAGQFLSPVPATVPAAGNGALAWDGTSGVTGFVGSSYLAGFWGPTPACTSGCSAALSVPIPLNVVGSGGTSTFAAGPITASVVGNPWQLTNTTLTGGLLNTATGTIPTPVTLVGTGFDNRTVGGNGVLQIISPIDIRLGALGAIPGLNVMTLTFSVPEPGTLLLLGAGIAGLAAMGRRNRK